MINNFFTLALVLNKFSQNHIENLLTQIQKTTVKKNCEVVFLLNTEDNVDFQLFSQYIKKYDIKNFLIVNVFNKLDKSDADWLVLSNSIGEYVYLIDEDVLNLNDISEDIFNSKKTDFKVFGVKNKIKQTFPLKVFYFLFKLLSRRGSQVAQLQSYAKNIKLISRNLINEFSNSVNPSLYLQNEMLGFEESEIQKINLNIKKQRIYLRDNFFHALSFSMFNSFRPLRFVSLVSIFLSFICLIYGVWVLSVYLQSDFTEGWVSTNFIFIVSFFMISNMLFFLSEYFIIQFKSNQINFDIKKEKSTREILANSDLNVMKIVSDSDFEKKL
jgi:hypothetical protein